MTVIVIGTAIGTAITIVVVVEGIVAISSAFDAITVGGKLI
ncbi:hypothetical protein [Peribacillus sp. FSL E2-0159]